MKRFLALLMVVLVACPSPPTPLQTNEALWKSRDIVNYEFTYLQTCMCPPPKAVILEVRNGVLVSARFADGSPGAVMSWYETAAPFEKMFRRIEETQRTGTATVVYDATYGFPTNVEANPFERVVDDEFFLTITNFKVL